MRVIGRVKRVEGNYRGEKSKQHPYKAVISRLGCGELLRGSPRQPRITAMGKILLGDNNLQIRPGV